MWVDHAHRDEVAVVDWEIVEDGKPYREWCVPAALINTHAAVTLMSDDKLDRMGAGIWRGYLNTDPPWAVDTDESDET